MFFKDLPAGSTFLFGKNKVFRVRYGYGETSTEEYLAWKKTNLNGLSVATNNAGVISFDYRRAATGENNYLKTHGHRLFFLSSLCKYLNGSDSSWSVVAPGDAMPRHTRECDEGFLSKFTDKEIGYIEPHNMEVTTPKGYIKKYGTKVVKPVLVGIPSIEELGTTDHPGTFGVNFDRIDTWVSDADSLSCAFRGWTRRTGGEISNGIMPVIKIKDNTPVDVDECGRYIIRMPETEFEGDIAEFLGIPIESAV